MKGENKVIVLFFILMLVGAGIVFLFINQGAEKKMIKFNACIQGCPKIGAGRLFPARDPECIAKCREKYGVSEEKYDEWLKQPPSSSEK